MTFGQFILTSFVPRHDGDPLDPDKFAGEQCVDVIKQLTNELALLGIRDISHWNTVTNGAEGMWNATHPILLKYFDKIPASERPFQIGDSVVWDKNKLPQGKYGHTAICIGDSGMTLKVFQQVGGSGVREGKAHKFTHIPSNPWYQYIVGALRPKESTLRTLGLSVGQAVDKAIMGESKPITGTITLPARGNMISIDPVTKILNKFVELWYLDFDNFNQAKGHIYPTGSIVKSNQMTKYMGETYFVPSEITKPGGSVVKIEIDDKTLMGFNQVDLDDYKMTKTDKMMDKKDKAMASPTTPLVMFGSGGAIAHQLGVDPAMIAQAIAGLYASGHLTTNITQIVKTKIPRSICKRYPKQTVVVVASLITWGAVEALPVFEQMTIHPNLKHALTACVGIILAIMMYQSGKLNSKG